MQVRLPILRLQCTYFICPFLIAVEIYYNRLRKSPITVCFQLVSPITNNKLCRQYLGKHNTLTKKPRYI